jgi:nitrate/TMAO reductase-like tetraheme cytochrome c subunit
MAHNFGGQGRSREENGPGFWRRLWRPSTKWPVLALLMAGLLVGAGATIGTQVMVAATGTDAFCGGACHSMQWVAKEHAQSTHAANRTGVRAGCHDCHIPHDYPEVLWYKTKAGIRDVIQEARGVIDTEQKFNRERLRLAQSVWSEYKRNDSKPCQHCLLFDAQTLSRQKEFVQPMHQQVLLKEATCIDCHKGIAHTAPTE